MKRIILVGLFAVPLAIPAAASARVNCANQPNDNVYEIAGPSCAIAGAVTRATSAAVLHGKLFGRKSYNLEAAGSVWRLTWRFSNTSGTIPGTHTSYSQIEFYRATSSHRLVTFHTYGSD
jgi:hypothetical protein